MKGGDAPHRQRDELGLVVFSPDLEATFAWLGSNKTEGASAARKEGDTRTWMGQTLAARSGVLPCL